MTEKDYKIIDLIIKENLNGTTYEDLKIYFEESEIEKLKYMDSDDLIEIANDMDIDLSDLED
jgi:hypothetical protein